MKILLATLALATLANAGERFQAGLWELTSSGGSNAGTTRTCLSPVAVSPVNGNEATARADAERTAAKYNMKIKIFSFKGNTVSMTMVSGTDVFVSVATYKGDTYDSKIISKTSAGETTKIITGKRLGACP